MYDGRPESPKLSTLFAVLFMVMESRVDGQLLLLINMNCVKRLHAYTHFINSYFVYLFICSLFIDNYSCQGRLKLRIDTFVILFEKPGSLSLFTLQHSAAVQGNNTVCN